MGPDGPKWGQEDFFPADPDLAGILDRTDLDFDNFYLVASPMPPTPLLKLILLGTSLYLVSLLPCEGRVKCVLIILFER